MIQPKLIHVQPVLPLKLKLFYETGEVKLFDVAPYATGSWYGELQDPSYFNTVHLLENGIGIEWENGQDIAPHELYELSARLPAYFATIEGEELWQTGSWKFLCSNADIMEQRQQQRQQRRGT